MSMAMELAPRLQVRAANYRAPTHTAVVDGANCSSIPEVGAVEEAVELGRNVS